VRRLAPGVFVFSASAAKPAASAEALWLEQLESTGVFVFGDGSHPTTGLCAGAVDVLCRQLRPASMLDAGTGTGILARIARARGVTTVVGTDIDAASLELACRNAALDTAVAPIQFDDQLPDHAGRQFELVVANILEAPLRQLAPALGRATMAGGTLLISGFTRLQAPALAVHYETCGFTLTQQARLDEWVLLRFTKASGTAGLDPAQ
jgi:ribosomal protein L11 methyltransferase